MFPLVAASLALTVLGLVLLAAVLYREGAFNQVSLPRWIGWRIDVDDAYDVWPADLEDRFRSEIHHHVTYREETRNG